jgi:hypothetical protein
MATLKESTAKSAKSAKKNAGKFSAFFEPFAIKGFSSE